MPKTFNKITPFNGGKITVQFNTETQEPVSIQVYEDIGEDPWMGTGFTAKDLSDALADIPRNRMLDVRVNSVGGSVWDGLAMKTLLSEWKAGFNASIDGMAASVASWFIMDAKEIRAPKHAQMFIHPAWGFVVGNADDMKRCADQLQKTSNQIADIYAKKSGMSSSECMDLMNKETLMTAEEAKEYGFIDKLTDDEPIKNFTDGQLANMRSKLAILNSIKTPAKEQGKTQNEMNKEQMIALLNKWGVSIPKDATDEQLQLLVESGKPKQKIEIKFKNGKDGEHHNDCKCGACFEIEPENDETNNRLASLLNKAEQREKAAVKLMVTNRVKACVEADKIPVGQMNDWIDDACNAADPDKVLNRLEALDSKPIGVPALSIEVGESTGVEDLNKAMDKMLEPSKHLSKNRLAGDDEDRKLVARNASNINRMLNSLKKFNEKGEMIGPIRQMFDAWASSPRNANTMTADLLRQTILSEIMRAFKRRFASLSYFAHTYQSVALEGTDYVKVPYYPLDTTASTEFKYSDGYVITPGSVTSSKSILVGGKGDGVASAGSFRKYKGLAFNAYEVRRQPWLNIAQLTVMAGEQLAMDVRAEIIGVNVKQANFGNAIWTGAPGGFDHTVVTQYLQLAALNADWPEMMRNCVLASAYYTALAADPGITPWMTIGSTDVLRKGIIGGLYGFDEITYDAKLPVANYIRGGDGTVTAGADPNLAGYICYPSAVLVATAPIAPPPGVLKKLVSYEQVVDDQTQLAFTYKYFGIEKDDADSEIIECCGGSNVGETAALKRLTSSGV